MNREPAWDQEGCYGDEPGENRRDCDGPCGYSYPESERANPAIEAEFFCSSCYDGVPHDFGEGETARIPVETNAQLVYGAEGAR